MAAAAVMAAILHIDDILFGRRHAKGGHQMNGTGLDRRRGGCGQRDCSRAGEREHGRFQHINSLEFEGFQQSGTGLLPRVPGGDGDGLPPIANSSVSQANALARLMFRQMCLPDREPLN
jgi:hypothetical protein